jgi:hypothetical protein
MAAATPIFIGGMYKSGTSLLRLMITQHGNIAGGLETYWFEVDPTMSIGRGGEPIGAYCERLAAYFAMPVADVRQLAASSPDAETFVDRLMTALAKKHGKPRWAEKTPGNIAHADRIVRYWPGARIVHIVRDPRDVYASLREAKKWDDAEAFGSRWCANFAGNEDSLRSCALRPGNYYEVRYESLVLHPERTMRPLIAFLGESWDPACAQFSGRENEYEVVRVQTGKASSTLARLRNPLSDSRVGLWKQVPPEELDAVRAYVGSRGFGARYDRIVSETEQAVLA